MVNKKHSLDNHGINNLYTLRLFKSLHTGI